MAMAKTRPDKKPTTLIIRTCKKCRARYEQETYQSSTLCDFCRPVKTCIHNIKITTVCQDCMARFGSPFQRVM